MSTEDSAAEVLAALEALSATSLEEASRTPDHLCCLLAKAHKAIRNSLGSPSWHSTRYSIHESSVSSLLLLFTSEDRYVRHSAKRVLLVFANCLEVSVSAWTSLLECIWSASRTWLSGSACWSAGNLSPNAYHCSEDEFHDGRCRKRARLTDSFGSAAEETDACVFWPAVTCALELLRCILKNAMEEEECAHSFLRVFLSQIAKVGCAHVMGGECVPTGCVCLNGGSPCGQSFVDIFSICLGGHCSDIRQVEVKELLLGSWLQLLSSSVRCLDPQQCQPLTTNYACLKQVQLLIPDLSDLALPAHKHHSHLLRYKLLTILMRLSGAFSIDQSFSVTCMDALRSNAEDLFNASLLQNDPLDTQSCVSSPFYSRLPSQTHSFRHSQRRVLLLYFKILASLKGDVKIPPSETSKEGLLHQHKQTSVNQVEEHLVCWLQAKLQEIIDTYAVDPNDITSAANRVTVLLVQLFLDEDDLLLDMLLQLSNLAPVLPQTKLTSPSVSSASPADPVEAIAPLRLCHAFLALIQYDHSVIVDFLISKQTGPLCLQYLMRCLRLIEETWPLFLSSVPQLADGYHQSHLGVPPMKDPSSMSVHKAGACLAQLRSSIQRLLQRQLFPYNPGPLLRRLTVFEDLMQLAGQSQP